jgi:hypothetical protein
MGVMMSVPSGVGVLVRSVIVPGMVVARIHAMCPYFNYAGEDP